MDFSCATGRHQRAPRTMLLYHPAWVTVETKLVFNVAALSPSELSSPQSLTVPVILVFRMPDVPLVLGRLTGETPCCPS